MENKEQTCRFTIDLPIGSHKQLKMLAIVRGKSMREIVIEAITEQIKLDDNGNIKFIKTL